MIRILMVMVLGLTVHAALPPTSLPDAIDQAKTARGADLTTFGANGAKALIAEAGKGSTTQLEHRYLLSALRHLHSTEAIPVFVKALNDKDGQLAESAAIALAATIRSQPRDSKNAVDRMLSSKHAEVRNQGLRLIAEAAWDISFAPRVRQILIADSEEANRIEAAYVLAARGVREAKSDLEKATMDKSESVSGAAKFALKSLGN